MPLTGGYPEDSFGDYVIPPVGLEDIDSALFALFDKELPIQVSQMEESTGFKKVPVIFAGGEKWALLKRNKPLRDKSNSLILPLITIGRTNFVQMINDDINGRGINQKTGEIVVRRRLDHRDRNYQNLINKMLVGSQRGVSDDPEKQPFPSSPGVGLLKNRTAVREGGRLIDSKGKNVFETIVVPTPQFITVTYDVIVWTQYTHHMNQITETLFSSYLPQTQGWRIETPKGYWFVAQVEEGSHSQENNVDDISQNERLIKQKFSIRVQAYIFASSAPGAPIPVKRYISVPEISFGVGSALDTNITNGGYFSDPNLGSDDPTLPLETRSRADREDKRFVGPDILIPPDTDPALQSFPRGKKPDFYKRTSGGAYVKITSENSVFGESSYTTTGGIDDLFDISLEE
jgi:hypothetical protein